ncbi:MAG: aryl-sulfate sulfotransferase [Deltaproteobacteria bacterium]|nr:aryl-sulfate sulfotransferase [Deltaproteobacteria bacterium]
MTRPLALLGLLACQRDPDDTGTTPLPDAIALTATAIPGAAANTLTVAWTPPDPGESWVEYGLDDAFDRRTPSLTGPTVQTRVLGLKSNRAYQWRAVTVLADGTRLESPAGDYLVPPPPQGLPELLYGEVGPTSALAGRYLLVQVGGVDQSWAVILDDEGDYVWTVGLPVGIQINHFVPDEDGTSVWIAQMDRYQLQDLGRIYRYDLGGAVLSDTRLPNEHHVAIPKAGTDDVLWIAHVTREQEVEPGVVWNVVSDEIRLAEEGSGEDYEVLYNFLDDGEDWFVPCSHVSATEELLGVPGYHEWTHTNSLVDAPDEGALYIAPRLHDALIQLDRETGEPRWQLGGVHSDFTVAADPRLPADSTSLWSHGHLNEVWADGFVLFDNNLHFAGGSRALEFAMDQDAKTAELVWSYTDPQGGVVPLLGDVRRLPNGHRLVTWTTWGRMTEHDPDGTVIWTAEAPVGLLIGRPTVLDDLYGLVESPRE